MFLMTGIPASTGAAPSVVLNPAVCVRAPVSDDALGRILVGRNWPHYKPFMNVCPVYGSSGQPILFVYTLDINNPNVVPYKNGKPLDMVNDTGPPEAFPLPELIDLNHKMIGSLPIQIYTSEPQSVQISFLDWRGNFPFKIAFHVIDPTESAPFSPYCPPPLMWHPALRKFIEAKGDFYAKCTPVG